MNHDDKGRFAPGNKGGPGRPPKEQSLTDILRSKVDAEEMAELMIGLAREGDLAAIKAVYDRVDGKPRESVDMNMSGQLDVDHSFRIVEPNGDS